MEKRRLRMILKIMMVLLDHNIATMVSQKIQQLKHVLTIITVATIKMNINHGRHLSHHIKEDLLHRLHLDVRLHPAHLKDSLFSDGT